MRLLLRVTAALAVVANAAAAQTVTSTPTSTVTSTARTVPSTARVVEYVCAGGYRVTARYSGSEAGVVFKGQTYRLPQAVSGDGFRYADERAEWRGRGDEAALTSLRTNTVLAANCRAADLASLGRPLAFRCPDGSSGTIAFAPGIVVLNYGNRARYMRQVPAASGVRYTDGELTFAGAGTSGGLFDAQNRPVVQNCEGGARLRGNVTYLQRVALPPSAVVEVQLQERRAGAPVVVLERETVQTAGRQVPIPFDLLYDPGWLEPGVEYDLVARVLVEGEVRWSNPEGLRVLAPGQATSGLTVTLNPAR